MSTSKELSHPRRSATLGLSRSATMRPSGLPLANDVRSVVVGHGLAELHKGIRPHDRGTSETLSNGTFKGPPSIGPGPLRALWVGSRREATFGEWPLFIQARPKAEAGDGQLAPHCGRSDEPQRFSKAVVRGRRGKSLGRVGSGHSGDRVARNIRLIGGA